MTSPTVGSRSNPLARAELSSATALPACPVCGGSAWSSARPGTQLRACGGCHTFLNDRSRTREEEESRYTRGGTGCLQGEGAVAAAQWRWLISAVHPFQDGEPLAVLDVGCGRGSFLGIAREAGARVMGIELDPTGADTCRAADIPVVRGSLFDAGPPPGPWDVITLWDVLDHLEDPAGALRLLVPVLAPGGTLVVRGRNARVHLPLKMGYARSASALARLRIPDVGVVHRWAFTHSGYLRLLNQAGLPIVRSYPAAPTPGDRYSTYGWSAFGRALKAGVWGATLLLFYVSPRRAYLFPSVLAVGRMGSAR